MIRIVTASGILIALAALAGCEADRMSEKGFSLPEGNAMDGQMAFVYLHCYECHTIEGIELPPVPSDEQPYVQLGGKVSRIKTYGQLVTSIINPSHRLAKGYPVDAVSVDGKSKMKNYNDAMTVTQLSDLVAFVQSKYKLLEHELTDYPMYGL